MTFLKFFLFLGFVLFAPAAAAGADDLQKEKNMRIKLNFNNHDVIFRMEDNPAAEQMIKMLPAEFEFTDFAGQEKIADFSRPLSLASAPRGMVATAGKMFIYAPWGNLGIFYKDHGSRPDKNLIPLGEVESGLEHLAGQRGGFSARLEVIED